MRKPDWQSGDGRVQLYCGDCMDVLPELDAASVDAVIPDPPYGIDYQSARRTDKADWKPKLANDATPFVWWLPSAARVLRPSGCLFCFCRWDVQEAFRLAIGWAGFTLKSQVVWDRDWHGMGDLNAAFSPQHDVAWFAVIDGFKFPGKRPPSVLRYRRVPADQMVHPTEKPVGLMVGVVEAITSDGDCVCDPTMGAGSTGVACVRTGRRFIGIEQSPEYFDIAVKRIETALRNPGLFTSAEAC